MGDDMQRVSLDRLRLKESSGALHEARDDCERMDMRRRRREVAERRRLARLVMA